MVDRMCSDPDCRNKAHTRGLCQRHFERMRSGQELAPLLGPNGDWHRITNVDADGRTGDCTFCGPAVVVKIRSSGRAECRTRAEAKRAAAVRRGDLAAERRRQKYGLSREQFQSLVTHQRGQCAICGSTQKLNVDHNHDTGEVRGLLCRSCNVGLGFLGDSPTRLLSAVMYLTANTSAQR